MEVTKADIDHLHDTIKELPRKLLDTKIKVKNGAEKDISVEDAIVQNWEKVQHLEMEIKDGTILVPITDSDDNKNFMSLTDILTTLYSRPNRWFSKSATFGDNASKIFKFVFEAGLIVYAIYTLFKAVQP